MSVPASLMLSPSSALSWSGPAPAASVNGNTYSGPIIAAAVGDVSTLAAAGWIAINFANLSTISIGPASGRPPASKGSIYNDQTLNAIIAGDGVCWRNVVSGNPV